MAFLEINFRSQAMGMSVPVSIILPENPVTAGAPEGTYKTLYLLHGLNGNHTDWMRKTAIERYAAKHGIAVVMPCGGRSWYTDTAYGANYFTFITEELPAVCRSYFKGMTDRREDNMIGGLSMGGYGAIKAAMTFPERYCSCIALSGALDITRKGRTYSLPEWQSIFGFNLESAAQLEGSRHDIFHLTQENAKNACDFPKLYLWCGTEDTLIAINRDYHSLLQELGVEHCYEEGPGNHTWDYWDPGIKRGLEYIFNK